MFNSILRAPSSSQFFQLCLFVLYTAFSSIALSADENLPPLFIDSQGIKSDVPIKADSQANAINLKTDTTPAITQENTETAEEKAISNHQQDDGQTEFINSEEPKKEKSILQPLSSMNQTKESLQELWLKIMPKPSLEINAETKTETEPEIPPLIDSNVELVDDEPTTFTPPAEGTEISTPDVFPPKPIITIIIDDLGYTRQGMISALQLPTEVTLAILPYTPFSKATAKASKKQSRTTILHVPMDNERKLKLGPGGLYDNMDENNFKDTLTNDINSVPGVTGINNHMGSLLTQDEQRMQWVMETIQPMQLFFIDSLTSSKSVAYSQAQTFGLSTTKRDVFLDNIQDESAINKQFERLIRIAKENGKALAIGHPHPSTMNYLLKRLPLLLEENIQLVSINDYMKLSEAQ